jgi:PAS domain S-box-containing protein
MRNKTGIRSLLLMLVVIAILPGLVMLVVAHNSTSHDAVQRGRQEIKAVGVLAAANQEQLIEGVRQILATVAAGPSVRRNDLRQLCYEFLRNVSAATPGYGNIGVVDLQGDIQCIANPGQQRINVADRAYFRNALRERKFAMGEYLIGRVSGKRQLGFGMPVYDDADVLVGVAFTTVDLLPAAQRLQSLPLPGSIHVDITDAEGRLLASSRPGLDRIGIPIENDGLRAAIVARKAGSLDLRDAQGTDWLYEFVSIDDVGGEGLFVIAGGRRDDVLASATRQLRQQLAVMALAALVGLVLAWQMGLRQIAQPVSHLLARMQAAARNQPRAEPLPAAAGREFSELATGLDTMLAELAKNQAQLLKAQQITRVGFYQLDLKTRLYTASETIYEMLGLDPAMGPVTVETYQAMIHPDDKALVASHRDMLFGGGKPLRLQYRIVRTDGAVRWVDGFGFVERDAGGTPLLYAGALQDVTEQHRLRRMYMVQSQINAAIVSATSRDALLLRVCQIAVNEGELHMAWVASMDPLKRTMTALVSAGADDGYTDLLNRAAVDVDTYPSPVPTALRTRELVVSNDIASDASMGSWAATAVRRGYKAVAAVPIVPAGLVPMALVLMADEPMYFLDEESQLLSAIGESLSAALDQLQRAAERQAREERLKLLETCVSRVNDIVLITEAEPFEAPGPRILYVNEAFERLTGYSAAETIGQTPRLLHGPKTQREVLDRIRRSIERWEPVREELINHRKDGSEFWLELDIVPIANEAGWFTHWVAIERDITQRKLAEQKEARLRGGFQLLFLGNPHPMWVFDCATRAFLEVNNAAIEQYGYSRDEFLALSIDDIRPESERIRLRNRAADVSPDGRESVGTWVHLRKNGSSIAVDITTQRLNYNGREAELVVAMDITDQVAMEQQRAQALMAVQASQASLARSQALARMGSWERRAQDRAAVWSASLYALTGLDPAAGAPSIEETLERVHPDDRAEYLQTMNACLGDGIARSWTYRCFLPDGSLRWFEENMDEPRRDASGAVVSVSGTVQDVTGRVEAEARLQLQLSRTELLNHIARATDERLDLDRIFHVVCDNIESRFSTVFSAALLFDPSTQAFTVAHLGTQGAARGAQVGLREGDVLSAADSGLSRCTGGELLYEPVLADAPFSWLQQLAHAGMGSVVFAPLQAQGEVLGVLVAGRAQGHGFDSGECEFMRQLAEHVALAASQARLHRSLQQAYDELNEAQQVVLQQERLRVLGQMASGIAHDINNAISPVALYTESLLVNESALSERGRAQLQTVQLAIDDVAETVARMRDFYRPSDAGVRRRAVDLNHLVKQVLDLTRARWRDMPQQAGISIDIALDLGDLLSPVFVMEGEIRDAVTNLVLNAVDAMPEGGTLTLRTRRVVLADGTGRVQLAVCDTGIGMDAETQRRCLEPFFTTKGQRGSGLGLAMVYGSMQRHGAEITIESAPGEGTTIRLGFPAHAEPAPVQVLPVHPPSLPRALKILLVDDDPLLLRSLSDTLTSEGHSVSSAAGGQEGIAVFKAALSAQVFDVVITDLGMPEVDGRSVAAAIKAASPGTPVVMLTGWGRRMQEEGECPPHVDHLLSKPPRLETLRAVFRTLA